MKRTMWIASLGLALVGTANLVACGGGSGGSSMTTTGGSNMAGASGMITGFGSVFVNGQEFRTDGNTQLLDGDNDDAPATDTDLMVGMTVDVDASGGKATLLRFTSAVRGEVDAVDPVSSTLTVLGQNVQVTSGTSFAGHVGNTASGTTPMQLSDIAAGSYVVVFGYLECPTASCSSGATNIVATLIVEPASIGKYRLQGYVSGYSASTNSFMINGLTVNIVTSGMSPTVCNTMNCSFVNGEFVAVRSSSAPTGTFPGSLTLAANDIKLRPVAPTFAAGATVTIEGPVTQLNGTNFVVRGISVDASGVAAATLSNNQIVEVTGTISSNGTLVATSIEVERAATFLLMGPVDSVSAMGFSVLGQSFTVTSSTRFGDWAHGVRPFNASDFAMVLMKGDQVIVSGYPSSSGNVATRVERIPTPASPIAGVEGIVSADNSMADTMTVEPGITVTLNSNTRLFYFGEGSNPTLAGFFGAITPNTSVAGAIGPPGPMTGTITAADAAVLKVPAGDWTD